MRPYKLLLTLFLLSSSFVYAHQDFWRTKTFGKVKVRIKTGYNYEEINKAWIIGELVNKLRRQLKYNNTIFIDFEHYYIGDCLPDYFISYDDGSIKRTSGRGDTIYFLKSKALVIREVSRTFDPVAILKLVEYAITNLENIKQMQKPLKYNKNYCQWLINSIDTSLTRQISLSKSSSIVNQTLKQKIDRPDTNDNCEISYFYQNNKYHIYFNEAKEDGILLMTDNIYQFQRVSFNEALVFNSDSTFYYIQGVNDPHASQQWTIKNKFDNWRPYQVAAIGSYKVSISFWVYTGEVGRQSKERILIYRSDKDQLIQDLDKILDK